MRLRFRRSQRTAGMMSKTTVFTLEARVDITEEEMGHLQKYKMGQEVIYSKERIAADRSGEGGLRASPQPGCCRYRPHRPHRRPDQGHQGGVQGHLGNDGRRRADCHGLPDVQEAFLRPWHISMVKRS